MMDIGFRVKNIHTGEVGRVLEWLSDGMVVVDFNGDKIPTFEEDLLPASESEEWEARSSFSKKLQKNKPTTPVAAEPQIMKIMGGFAQNRGIFLAFLPDYLPSGLVEKYKIWLVNDASEAFLFVFSLKISRNSVAEIDEKSLAYSARFLGNIAYDDLNEQPEINLSMRLISTFGAENPIDKSQKIRPKSFFQRRDMVDFMGEEGHLIWLISKKEDWDDLGKKSGDAANDLAEYSKKLAKKKPPTASSSSPVRWLDLEEKAHFLPEIDLHIEKLTENHDRLTPAEIVQIQLRQADIFIDDAWRVGMEQVFLIHGLGAGKLRDMLHARLRKNDHIAWFKNEWHRKYGYGATEVLFK